VEKMANFCRSSKVGFENANLNPWQAIHPSEFKEVLLPLVVFLRIT
jgi:hypothetical protein